MENALIKREFYVEKLMSRRMNGFVKVITGVRRCGKSYLLDKLFRQRLLEDGVKGTQIISVDLDDKAYIELRNPLKLDEYVRKKIKRGKQTYYVFIDEIQQSHKILPPGIDLGLRNARINFRDTDPSHPMENVIYNELLRRGYSVDVGVVPIVTRDKEGKQVQKQHEIDFVINRGNDKIYIQSAYQLPTKERESQETASLRGTGDYFKKIVITEGYGEPMADQDGIIRMGIIPFLMNEGSVG